MPPRPNRRTLTCGLLGLALAALFACGLLYRGVRPSPTCSFPTRSQPQAGLTTHKLTSGGLERCYLLYIPEGYDPTSAAPLVISLHGFASQPEGQMRFSGWNDLAEAEKFAVVYPQGTSFPLRWNSEPERPRSKADDLRFMRDLISDVSRLVTLDPARIYVNGLSNGGGMAVRVGCELADIVAAIGSVSGATQASPADCQPSRPVPLIAFHGTGDPIVRYEGAEAGASFLRVLALSSDPMGYRGVEAWVGDWAQLNGCDSQPTTLSIASGVKAQRFTGCQEEAEVVLYIIEGGGHNWPGGSPIPFMGVPSKDVDATAVMWEFFKAHPMGSPSSQG